MVAKIIKRDFPGPPCVCRQCSVMLIRSREMPNLSTQRTASHIPVRSDIDVTVGCGGGGADGTASYRGRGGERQHQWLPLLLQTITDRLSIDDGDVD